MILPSGLSTTDYSRTAAAKGWGTGWPACGGMAGNLVQVTAPLSGTLMAGGVHKLIAPLVTALLAATESRGYRMVPGWCWGGGCRAIAGTNTPSNHSWGLALDLNAPANPYTSSGQHDIPDWVFTLWRTYGFGVGADYRGKQDWMHFEFMGSPADAGVMTILAARTLQFTAPSTPTPGGGAADDEWWFDMATDEQRQELKQQVHDALIWFFQEGEGSGIDALLLRREVEKAVRPLIKPVVRELLIDGLTGADPDLFQQFKSAVRYGTTWGIDEVASRPAITQ